MKTGLLSLSFFGKAIIFAALALVAGNALSFWVLYADTFTPFSLPYHENFDQPIRLRYRQFGGLWRIQDDALFQTDAKGTDLLAVIPMTLSAAQPYHFETAIKIVNGPNGGGLMFNLQNDNNTQRSHLVRFGSDKGRNYLVFGYFDETSNFVAQGSVEPPDLTPGVKLAVDVHEESYDVLVNDQPIQRAVPLQYKGGKVALTTWFSNVSFDEVALWAIDPQLPVAQNVDAQNADAQNADAQNANAATPQAVAAKRTLTETQPMTGEVQSAQVAAVAANVPPITATTALSVTGQGAWTPFSGQWAYENGKLVQTIAQGFDHGISRAGSVGDFEMSVRLRHRQGVGGGVLFHLPTATSQNGGHMVRFFEDNSLAWGYFSSAGVFTGQGFAAIAPPGSEPQLLKVIAISNTYSITLNGTILAENIPLISKEGLLGLTSSTSVVEFDEINVVTNQSK